MRISDWSSDVCSSDLARTQAAGVASTATGPHPLGSTPEPRMDPSQNPSVFHATTIVSVRRNGHVVVAGDGQGTLGNTVMKSNARKVRRLGHIGKASCRERVGPTV